jgi:acyl-coenzyme A thioesterase PaaI-like protein
LAQDESLQERYAPASDCFGCGPANRSGLRIRSVIEGDVVVSRWTPRPRHRAFGSFLNGGIISTILDCHSNWTAAYSLMRRSRSETVPPTVTASFCVRFLRPTPIGPLLIEARPSEVAERKVVVDATLKAAVVVVGEAGAAEEGEGGAGSRRMTTTATLTGEFVAVGPTHPASLRWVAERKRGGPKNRLKH